jgi:biofilm PGA synthesis N-glycosyltransferase PgaC
MYSLTLSRAAANNFADVLSSPPAPPAATGSLPLAALHQLMQRAVPITFVAGMFPLRSETFVYREVRALRERGWDVCAVSLHDSPDESAAGLGDFKHNRLTVYDSGAMQTLRGLGVELVEHPLKLLRTLGTAVVDAINPQEQTHWKDRLKLIGGAVAGIGLAGRLGAQGTRHLHCHFAHAPTTVGMYAAMQLGIPFSFTGHANDLFQRRILLKKKLERAVFVACISRWHRELYRSIAPADDLVYPVVRCGVDVRSWTAEPPAQTNGQFHVLCIARLVEKKGIDLLLRALAKCEGLDWHLNVAGDGPERARLGGLVEQLNIAARVEFLGAVSNDRVRELLAGADLFALPCRCDTVGDRDGIPVVLMEAMARGVPVISGDLPTVRELIEPDVSGVLVPSGDTDALAAAILKLAAEPATRIALAAAGRAKVERDFALDTNVAKLEQMIEQSINHGPTPTERGDQPAPGRRYALITPCRDEAQYARRTLECVTRQSVPPAIWVIVDDGSRDETPAILAEYASRFPYIKIVTRPDRGDRKLGGGVIDAFYSGYETINPAEYNYIAKLDLDLDLPLQYFQKLMERMEANPRIGTASGKPYFVQNGKAVSEMCGDENSVGMVKFYRTACFEQIGGFVRELMWDGIDCHRCRMAGWIALSWDSPELSFEHLRPMGTSHKNWWTGRVRHGVGQYFMGTSPAYMLASAMFRMTRPPVVIGGLAMLWGYIRSAWERKPRYGDASFRRFLRRYQLDSLLRGKAAATECVNRRNYMVWENANRFRIAESIATQSQRA